MVLSQKKFLKGDFRRNNFLCGNFPSGNVPKVRLEAPQAAMGAEYCGWDGLVGLALRLEQARGTSAVARSDLRSWRLGNLPFWKLPLGKLPLGKVPNFVYNAD